MRSTSMDETAFIVCNMAYKIGKDMNKKPYFSENVTNSTTNANMKQGI